MHDTSAILRWFSLNSMVANPEKFQVMFLGVNDNLDISFEISGINISATNTVKLLGVEIDHKLTFSVHKGICNRVSNQTKAFLRIRRYINLSKASLICNAYVFSHFSIVPLFGCFATNLVTICFAL